MRDADLRAILNAVFGDKATIDFLGASFKNPFNGIDPIFGANMSRGNLLRPYPHFGNINGEQPIGYSRYHSMQNRIEKRFSQGFTFQLAHTWSKLMEATEFLNNTDPMPYYSIGSFDRPHRIAGSGIWEIPVGRGRAYGSTTATNSSVAALASRIGGSPRERVNAPGSVGTAIGSVCGNVPHTFQMSTAPGRLPPPRFCGLGRCGRLTTRLRTATRRTASRGRRATGRW